MAVNDVERNEDGMEEMSAFFSPAPPSIPDEDYSDELDEPVHTIATSRLAGDVSASMDLNQSLSPCDARHEDTWLTIAGTHT